MLFELNRDIATITFELAEARAELTTFLPLVKAERAKARQAERARAQHKAEWVRETPWFPYDEAQRPAKYKGNEALDRRLHVLLFSIAKLEAERARRGADPGPGGRRRNDRIESRQN